MFFSTMIGVTGLVNAGLLPVIQKVNEQLQTINIDKARQKSKAIANE